MNHFAFLLRGFCDHTWFHSLLRQTIRKAGIADEPARVLSYAKIGMKAKTFESRVFEMEYSSLKTEY